MRPVKRQMLKRQTFQLDRNKLTMVLDQFWCSSKSALCQAPACDAGDGTSPNVCTVHNSSYHYLLSNQRSINHLVTLTSLLPTDRIHSQACSLVPPSKVARLRYASRTGLSKEGCIPILGALA